MARPEATEGEIQFILGEINSYLQQKVTVRRGDVLAAWSGECPRIPWLHEGPRRAAKSYR